MFNMRTDKISIGLEHDQTIFKRQQDALRNFVTRPYDHIKLSILGQPSQVELHSKYFRTYQTYASAPGQDLNSAQRDAVTLVMCWPLSLIQGPPGTGKTHTIVAMVFGLLKKSPQTKVLCCAPTPSNDPTDHLAVQLAKYLPEYEVTRVTSGQVVHEDLQENIRKLTASDGTSLMNGPEARLVLLILTDLLHRGVRAEDIGVITFYNGQRGHLENLLERHHCISFQVQQRIMIDSVDAFQGREKDFIILSCVRSGNQRTTSIGFLKDPRRINVAITRAKTGVVIVGNLSLLRKDRVWSSILSYYPVIEEDALLDKLGGIVCAYCSTDCIVLDAPDESNVVRASPKSSLSNNFWLRVSGIAFSIAMVLLFILKVDRALTLLFGLFILILVFKDSGGNN